MPPFLLIPSCPATTRGTYQPETVWSPLWDPKWGEGWNLNCLVYQCTPRTQYTSWLLSAKYMFAEKKPIICGTVWFFPAQMSPPSTFLGRFSHRDKPKLLGRGWGLVGNSPSFILHVLTGPARAAGAPPQPLAAFHFPATPSVATMICQPGWCLLQGLLGQQKEERGQGSCGREGLLEKRLVPRLSAVPKPSNAVSQCLGLLRIGAGRQPLFGLLLPFPTNARLEPAALETAWPSAGMEHLEERPGGATHPGITALPSERARQAQAWSYLPRGALGAGWLVWDWAQ